MVFGAVVDTVIGLVLIFLLFSILVSTVMEALSGILKLRAQALENSIANLIDDPQAQQKLDQAGAAVATEAKGLSAMFVGHRRAATANAAAAKAAGAPPLLTYSEVYNHPLVAGTSGTDQPSYVPAANFALALIQVLASKQGQQTFANVEATVAALPAGDLKTTLQTLLAQAAGSLDALKTGIETWFDSAMDRLSGQYKRFTQVITFIVALGFAVAFNVDTLNAFHRLYADPVARAALEAGAEQQLKGGTPPTPPTSASGTWTAIQAAQGALAKLEPVGWNGYGPADDFLSGLEWFALAALGWVMTAAAALMGAPFWFDALNTFMNVRNAGPKPTSSTSGS
jgi:hypothetical protein